MAPIDDSFNARISPDCPDETKQILQHAWAHDTETLKNLLDTPGKESAQDPNTSETPLHAAIRACGSAPQPAEGDEDVDNTVEQEACETVHELFLSGAIWNDLDNNNETPGCVAFRLGRKELYQLCVEAGVRAEFLLGLLEGYEELSSDPEDDVEIIQIEETKAEDVAEAANNAETGREISEAEPGKSDAAKDVNSEQYLASGLTYDAQKLVDDQGNGVMMAWETSIMRRSVDSLLKPRSDNSETDASRTEQLSQGKRILNIGFGMGIVDAMFADTNPSRHHIIEAHPAVLSHIDADKTSFGKTWEGSGPEEGAFKVHRGRWQEIVPELIQVGEVYDAIYFDTFGEDYAQLRMFFTEYVPGLMEPDGRFGFFNGLGADRRVCYDVYTKVVEMHTMEAGLDLEWEDVEVDLEGMDEAGRGEWDGVRRRYWTLDRYRLPTCTFLS